MSIKRGYYETLEVERERGRFQDQGSVPQARDEMASGQESGRCRQRSRFKEINEAYEVLKDGDKRAAYDRFGHAAFEQGHGRRRAWLRRRFRLVVFGYFRRSVRHGRAARRGGGRERGADLRYNMEITLEEAFSGKTAQIEIPVSVTCESCSGTGAKAGTKPKTCPTCGGAGRVRQARASSRSSGPAPAARAAAR